MHPTLLTLLLWPLLLCGRAYARTKPLPPPPDYNEQLDDGTFGYYPEREYVTAGGVKSPETNFLQWSPPCHDGKYTFMTPRGFSLPLPGPMILDGRGELIWGHHFDNAFGGEAYNFLVQRYKGQDILSFWLGDDRVRGHGSGYYYLMNSSYDIIGKVTAANGLTADLHEFLITDDDTVLMTIYETVPGDVTMFRDFDADSNPEDVNPNFIWDGIFQEIDVDSGKALFEWRASEHINLTETYRPIYGMGNMWDPFDWFHINSIEKDELGNYLISARYTHSITYIDGRTGKIIWSYGGKSNYFMDLSSGNATNFAWQHDARFHSVNTFPNIYTPPPPRPGFTTKLLTLFDNAAEDQHYEYSFQLSRALLVELTYPTPGTERALQGPVRIPVQGQWEGDELDLEGKKMFSINGTDPDYLVRVIKTYENPNWVHTSSQGNIQVLPQGPGQDPKLLVGYGLNAVWTEYDSNGTVLCDAHYGAKISWERGDAQSYRTYKFDWTGTPRWPPKMAINDDDTLVYVSWLGSTEIDEWMLQGSMKHSEDEEHWKELGRVDKINFETIIEMPDNLGDVRYMRAVAIGGDGQALPHGVSKIVDRGILATDPAALLQQALTIQTTRWSPLKISLVVACNVSGFFVLYELYRRYLGWRHGRHNGGAFRFRKTYAYKLMADA